MNEKNKNSSNDKKNKKGKLIINNNIETYSNGDKQNGIRTVEYVPDGTTFTCQMQNGVMVGPETVTTPNGTKRILIREMQSALDKNGKVNCISVVKRSEGESPMTTIYPSYEKMVEGERQRALLVESTPKMLEARKLCNNNYDERIFVTIDDRRLSAAEAHSLMAERERERERIEKRQQALNKANARPEEKPQTVSALDGASTQNSKKSVTFAEQLPPQRIVTSEVVRPQTASNAAQQSRYEQICAEEVKESGEKPQTVSPLDNRISSTNIENVGGLKKVSTSHNLLQLPEGTKNPQKATPHAKPNTTQTHTRAPRKSLFSTAFEQHTDRELQNAPRKEKPKTHTAKLEEQQNKQRNKDGQHERWS